MPDSGIVQYNHHEVLPNDYSTLGITQFVQKVAADTLQSISKHPALPVRPPRISKQGEAIPYSVIEGPSAWVGSELQKHPKEYIYYVTEDDVAEIDAAIDKVTASGVTTGEQMLGLTKESFPLPTFGPTLRQLVDEGVHTRGFQMLRGIPVSRYSSWQLNLLWWGLGLHIGRALPINRYGHLMNHIQSLDNDTQGKRTRAPNTNQPQIMHSDQFATDIIGLFAISKAKSGGESTFVSSITIHNELLKRGREDLVRTLTQRNFWLNRTGYADGKQGLRDPETGEPRYFPVAPFVYHDGRLSVANQSTGYYTEQEEPEIPRLTPLQLEALRTVQALAIDPQLSMQFLLQPGDVQLLHNTTVMHGRNGFTDGQEPAERRHLLRWWLDSSGIPVEELRAKKPLPCFGERLRDPSGGWPFAKTPYSIVLDTAQGADADASKFL